MLYLCLVNYFEYLVGVARDGLQAPPQHGASEGAPRGGELLPVADDSLRRDGFEGSSSASQFITQRKRSIAEKIA